MLWARRSRTVTVQKALFEGKLSMLQNVIQDVTQNGTKSPTIRFVVEALTKLTAEGQREVLYALILVIISASDEIEHSGYLPDNIKVIARGLLKNVNQIKEAQDRFQVELSTARNNLADSALFYRQMLTPDNVPDYGTEGVYVVTDDGKSVVLDEGASVQFFPDYGTDYQPKMF